MDWDLTERQRDVLKGYVDGQTTPEIAEDLEVAPTTIETHRRAIQDAGVPLEYDHAENEWFVDGSEDGLDVPEEESDGTDVSDDAEDAEDEDDTDGVNVPELDERQHRAIRLLPATVAELDAAFDDVDGHAVLDLLRDDGVTVRYDPEAEKYYLADERSKELRSKTHLSLSAKTKRAKQALREEHALLDRLPPTTPLSIDDHEPDPDNETLVAAFGDLHFGDKETDDRGRVTYDREIAHEAADQFAEKVIRHKRQWAADFDECVIPILGDIATGTQIYHTQQHDIEELLAQQIEDGAAALTRVVSTIRDHFDAVRVYAVVGNHGFQDPSASRGSNTDHICYKWMQDALRREGYDDVEVTIASDSHHLNFEVRGWRFHVRHGQDSQQQVDETARSEADWRGWRDDHQFDVGIRGHHHVPSLHWVLNRYPVVTTPSPKPGGEFADRIGAPDSSTPAERAAERKLGYCFGVSEDRRMTDSRMTDGA